MVYLNTQNVRLNTKQQCRVAHLPRTAGFTHKFSDKKKEKPSDILGGAFSLRAVCVFRVRGWRYIVTLKGERGYIGVSQYIMRAIGTTMG